MATDETEKSHTAHDLPALILASLAMMLLGPVSVANAFPRFAPVQWGMLALGLVGSMFWAVAVVQMLIWVGVV